MIAGKDSFRYDIEGLRALAVLGVLIHHIYPFDMQSGYLGVDVFFTISGFVIASSFLRRRHSTRFDFFSSFWIRRIKRLLPALFTVTVASVLFALLFDPLPNESIELGAAGLVGLSNVYLIFNQLDYFSSSSAFNFFTHTWSLSVEEQFYFIFSLLAVIFLTRTRLLFGLVSAFTAISFVLFLVANDPSNPINYYGLHTRFWQIGVGVLLAFLHKDGFFFSMSGKRIIVMHTGVVVALIALFFLPESGYALKAVATALFVSALLSTVPSWTSTAPNITVLSNPVARYIGRISYSLYLWHWPVIVANRVIPDAYQIGALGVIALSIALASLTYHLIENPIRHRKSQGRYVGLAWVATVCIAVGFTLGAAKLNVAFKTFVSSSGWLKPPQLLTLAPAFEKLPGSGLDHDPMCVVDGGSRVLTDEKIINCTYQPKQPDGQMFWVFGDSHAGHLQGMFVKMYSEFGYGFHLIETPGSPYPILPGQPFEPRERIVETVTPMIQPGDTIVLPWLMLTREEPPKVHPGFFVWADLVEELVLEIEPRGVNIILTTPPPMFDYQDIRECLTPRSVNCSVDRRLLLDITHPIVQRLQEIANNHPNAYVFDTFSILCPSDRYECRNYSGGTLTFRDRDHINVEGSRLLVNSFLRLTSSESFHRHADGS